MKKNTVSLIMFCLALFLAGAAGAENWTVKMKAVNGRAAYSHEQVSPLGKQSSFVGRPQMRGGGPARELTFNSFLNAPEDGLFRLDYLVELAGEHQARPPLQAAGKVLLRPGKPVLAAEAGGWKFIVELQGKAGERSRRDGSGILETSLKCGRVSYPANFVYLPDEQYSAVLYTQSGDTVSKFMVGLLPKSSAMDGTFLLQYTLLLKEGGETLAGGQGELILAPGEGKRTAAAGKDCVFSAKALH
ncbi:MAG: hypothetical protein Q7R35_10115 [Elusimicrobiota bacterium]|nr:hypothetical protein [Elusimicrobiota bacterium]